MKLLLVSPFTSGSGSAIRFWNMAQQFKTSGFDVVYTDRKKTGSPSLYHIDGITYAPSPAVHPFFFDILYSTVFNIYILFKNLDCSVFYALKPAPNNCIAALLAKLLGKKILLDIDDLDYEYFKPGLKQTLSRFFFRLFPKHFPLVTCHTPNLLDYCKKDLHLQENRLYYLAQGVSEEFLKIDVRTRPLPPPKSIVYVATLGITSDFEDVLPILARVCAAHRDTTISVIGDGVRRRDFEASAAKLGLAHQIKFLGSIPHAELAGEMARHRIGLNYMRPTFVNNCRAILKIREYLACGMEVVCNDSGDARLFADFIHIEQNVEQIGERLSTLLLEKPVVNVLGRTHIETCFSWKTIMTAFLQNRKLQKLLSRAETV